MPRTIQIDQRIFENLCEIQSTKEEIAHVLGCSPDTIERWCKKTYGHDKTFSEVYAQFSDYGKVSIRRQQFKHMKNSPTMSIFLGKQYLGQRDIVHEEVTCEDLGCLADMLRLDTGTASEADDQDEK